MMADVWHTFSIHFLDNSSIVCSVKEKEKGRTTQYTGLFFRQIHRLSPVALTKGHQTGQHSMILQPARTFSTLFFQHSDYT